MTAMTTRYINVEDYRSGARRTLPRSVFELVDSGAGDEITLRENRVVFEAVRLRPRALGDVSSCDIGTTVLGQAISMPVLLAPCGYSRMVHREAEMATGRAAQEAGTVFCLSTVTSFPLEDVARASTGPKWFQLYPPADPDECRKLVERAKAAGFKALCVTIDGATLGLRERDKRNGLTVPMRITPKLLAEGAVRPRWAWDFVRGGVGRGGQGLAGSKSMSIVRAGEAVASVARSVTSKDIEFIREIWDGALLIKGVQRGDEIDELVNLGVDAVIVSNHGGRQLDGVPGAIEILPEVVARAGGRIEVLIDSGFRRGTDIVKALALGASAVLIGRPYLYGLAVNGQAGVEDVLRLLASEIRQTMLLLGYPTIDSIDAAAVSTPATSTQSPHR